VVVGRVSVGIVVPGIETVVGAVVVCRLVVVGWVGRVIGALVVVG
jgi:hypothetical protein